MAHGRGSSGNNVTVISRAGILSPPVGVQRCDVSSPCLRFVRVSWIRSWVCLSVARSFSTYRVWCVYPAGYAPLSLRFSFVSSFAVCNATLLTVRFAVSLSLWLQSVGEYFIRSQWLSSVLLGRFGGFTFLPVLFFVSANLLLILTRLRCWIVLTKDYLYLLENPMFTIAIKPLRQWMWHNYVIFTPSTRHRLTPIYSQTPRRMRVHVILLHQAIFLYFFERRWFL